ncbi:monovalent cation/H+ antiporter subunit D [Pseudomonas sp. Marseille-QA0892]
MSHLIAVPIVLPLLVGSLLLMLTNLSLNTRRIISLASTWILLPVSIALLNQAGSGELTAYAMGNWQPPFGIILLLDRLSALMLFVSAVLAAFALLYAVRGDDELGPNFHALFQFQLVGINGAFLTGDLFNLFVFFEILLIASYSLLLHGSGAARVRSGMHYVVLNLVGSSLFLIGVGTLYGLLGTLNMADLAVRVSEADPERLPIIGAAGLVLLVVFGLKGAILPLYFWLPRAYASATAPVAALFAIMTKIGLYAIIRVFFLIFGSAAGALADMVLPWLWPLAILTLAAGVVGALAARNLQVMLGYLVIVSVGTLLAGVALGSERGLAGALYYLVHSTWISGALFLLADLIARQRGPLGSDLVSGPVLANPLLLSAAFFAGAISIAGLPPLSGFLGKVMLLQATTTNDQALALWPVVLIGGLGMLIALSRAGSTLFWRTREDANFTPVKADTIRTVAAFGLLAGSVVLVVAAGPVHAFTQAIAEQLLDVRLYMNIIRGGAV